MTNINFGIDLGTTNSGIAKYENGKITLFKNPIGFKDFLPSVVSFRKGRIQTGDKAREHISVDAMNVFSSFKRKMGTSQTYFIPSLEKETTPIELSSTILKELLGFTSEEVQSTVITIPASFDTIQSNATKKAGYAAGLKEVVLLQEPIAACLAYSNEQSLKIENDLKWLVYDYGGGTFDVTLVAINNRELNVIDHQGNNFLGGLDFDNAIIEHLIVPKIEEKLGETNIWSKMTKKEGDTNFYTKLYFELLLKAEEIKKELSVKEESQVEIELDNIDDYIDITIERAAFEEIIKKDFDTSFQLLESLLTKNSTSFSEIERIILVGGTTFIPFIREELHKRTNIIVDHSIDPTTAVTVGAAYYAGSKPSALEETAKEEAQTVEIQKQYNIKSIFEPNSNDNEELIVILAPEVKNGRYRIVRRDGAFDTGRIPFSEKANEFVPLLKKVSNSFTVSVYDENDQEIYTNPNVVITNGLYNISGQPLPNDILLEVDESKGETKLETIFKKNDILPLKKTVYKTISKNILKNSSDKLIINIQEGNSGGMIGSNLTIGYVEISGERFQEDLIKGMDIELNFHISESRDLNVKVYIPTLDLEIQETFNPHERTVSISKLLQEIKNTVEAISLEIREEEQEENFEYLAKLKRIQNGLLQTYNEALELSDETITDQNYKIDELKRNYIQEFDNLVRFKHVLNEISEYQHTRDLIENYLEGATDKQKQEFEKIVSGEKEILQSGNKYSIKSKTKELDKLLEAIYYSQDSSYIQVYYFYKFKDTDEYKDTKKYHKLCELGDSAVERNNFHEIKAVCHQLYDLLKIKPRTRDERENFDGDLGLK
ncbi:Hsp70 family protein [Flavobacterium sp. U410]